MALKESISLHLRTELQALGRAMDAAKARRESTEPLVAEFMQRYGWTDHNRVYRHLGAIGWKSGKARRKDAGTSSVSQEVIEALGAATRLGLRENGKQTMEVPNAVSIFAGANGYDIPVGPARLRTLLRQHHLSTAAARAAHSTVAMRSLHPNHVHQVDPSLCLLYYGPDGRQHVLRDSEIYKNKSEWAERVGNLKCWRYVLYDHRSAVVIVRYYQAKGENQANLYDFLLYCWRKTGGRVFHGVGWMLVWDKGSANIAAAIRNALDALAVEHWTHAKGHSWAKGGVENANNLVEKGFESRLKYEPVRSIEQLNRAAEAWYNAWNANLIPRLDSRIRRPGIDPIARYDLWMRDIRREHLRLLPDDETCRLLLTVEPESRKVRSTGAGGLSIQYRHPILKRTGFYDLARVPGVVRDMTVQVSPLFYADPGAVLVTVADYRGDETHHVLAPVAFDEAGQRADAPVWGERFRSNPETAAEQAAKAADAVAYPGLDQEAIEKAKARNAVPFEGKIDAHSHLAEVYLPTYLDRPGTELEVANPVRVQARMLNATDLCAELIRRLGPAWVPDMGAAIFGAYPEGAPETDIPALAAWLRSGEWDASAPLSASAAGAMAGRPRLAAVK
jgi:hypothetical protein